VNASELTAALELSIAEDWLAFPIYPPLFTDCPPASGVYRLWDCGEMVYVGQSKDIRRRIVAHRRDKVFNRAEYMTPTQNYRRVEAHFILSHFLTNGYLPRYNMGV
jgi:excinuclease UvrABC nuclease subunit